MLSERLRALLPDTIMRLKALNASIEEIARDAFHLAEEMDFGFLLDKGRSLLSIGYDVATRKLHKATYDMLASEARIATFLAIAKGDIPQQSWFKLARTHTIAYDRPVLLSWTGTMFEYLMPSLWMRRYRRHADRAHPRRRCRNPARFRSPASPSVGHLRVGLCRAGLGRTLSLSGIRNSCDGAEVGRYRGPGRLPVFELSRAGHRRA